VRLAGLPYGNGEELDSSAVADFAGSARVKQVFLCSRRSSLSRLRVTCE
jgi:hypothetical protein